MIVPIGTVEGVVGVDKQVIADSVATHDGDRCCRIDRPLAHGGIEESIVDEDIAVVGDKEAVRLCCAVIDDSSGIGLSFGPDESSVAGSIVDVERVVAVDEESARIQADDGDVRDGRRIGCPRISWTELGLVEGKS